MSVCGFHGGPATVPCDANCDMWLWEATTSKPKQVTEINTAAGRLEIEARWLEIIAYLTSAWLLIGAVGTVLVIVFTASAWGFLFMVPCAACAVLTWIQIGRVTSMIDALRRDDD